MKLEIWMLRLHVSPMKENGLLAGLKTSPTSYTTLLGDHLLDHPLQEVILFCFTPLLAFAFSSLFEVQKSR